MFRKCPAEKLSFHRILLEMREVSDICWRRTNLSEFSRRMFLNNRGTIAEQSRNNREHEFFFRRLDVLNFHGTIASQHGDEEAGKEDHDREDHDKEDHDLVVWQI